MCIYMYIHIYICVYICIVAGFVLGEMICYSFPHSPKPLGGVQASSCAHANVLQPLSIPNQSPDQTCARPNQISPLFSLVGTEKLIPNRNTNLNRSY